LSFFTSGSDRNRRSFSFAFILILTKKEGEQIAAARNESWMPSFVTGFSSWALCLARGFLAQDTGYEYTVFFCETYKDLNVLGEPRPGM
jgi:uncharacterized protein (DUF2237 family)